MPWREVSIMDERREFGELAMRGCIKDGGTALNPIP